MAYKIYVYTLPPDNPTLPDSYKDFLGTFVCYSFFLTGMSLLNYTSSLCEVLRDYSRHVTVLYLQHLLDYLLFCMVNIYTGLP